MVLKKEKESAKSKTVKIKSKSSTKTVAKKEASKTIKKEKKTLKVKKEMTTGNKMVRRFNKLRLKAEESGKRGIVYVGHLPKGFNEEELKKFFGQFGTVSKLRVSRSKKTGRSKGYAFLEFQDKEVASIAVGAMDKYLMFGK